MTRTRCFSMFVLFTIAVAAVTGETLAVTVRLSGEPDADGRDVGLLSMIEEGAMDTMFDMGHIVFDIDLDDELQLSWYDAIDSARFGGARYLVVIDAGFGVEAGVGFLPDTTVIRIVEVRSEQDNPAEPVEARLLPGAFDKTPEALSRDVGQLAALNALSAIREVSW